MTHQPALTTIDYPVTVDIYTAAVTTRVSWCNQYSCTIQFNTFYALSVVFGLIILANWHSLFRLLDVRNLHSVERTCLLLLLVTSDYSFKCSVAPVRAVSFIDISGPSPELKQHWARPG